MGYAGYAPGHKVVELTVLQQLLKLIKSDKSLETLEKLTRNSAQAPAEEKFRKVRRGPATVSTRVCPLVSREPPAPDPRARQIPRCARDLGPKETEKRRLQVSAGLHFRTHPVDTSSRLFLRARQKKSRD